MAVAAEQLNYETSSYSPEPFGTTWINARDIAGLQSVRTSALLEAEALLDSRMQQLRDGEFDAVPYDVDPLTTAGRAVRAKAAYGETSHQYRETKSSLCIDSQRLFAEANRKGAWEYFPPLEQTHDAALDSYTFKGYPLNEMVASGLTPMAESEEVVNRTHEYVEEATYLGLRTLGRLAIGNLVVLRPVQTQAEKVTVTTLSPCADWAIAAAEQRPGQAHGGYAPEIKKLMIRGIRYAGPDSRFQEQLGISGEYITPEVINEALQMLRVTRPGEYLDKTAIRATQMISLGGEGVLDMAQLLDDIASARSGKRIFMGEAVADHVVKDYDSIPAIAAERQAKLEAASNELADYLEELETAQIDHWVANTMVGQFVQQRLLAHVKADPAAAAIAFDHKTAAGFMAAAQQRSLGNEAEAQRLEAEVALAAPAVSYCGAGSCGLEAVNTTSEDGKALAKELQAKPGDKIVKDKERACKCGSKSVVYAYNKTKVNKLCQNCGAFESKASKAA